MGKLKKLLKTIKFYAVRNGRKIGIFNTWEECKAQVHCFSKAEYKSFFSLHEAQAYLFGDDKNRPRRGPLDEYFKGENGKRVLTKRDIASANK